MNAAVADGHARSLRDPEGFWGEAAAGLDGCGPFERALADGRPGTMPATLDAPALPDEIAATLAALGDPPV